jgi:small-conductance mechanosensitive channel
MPHLINLLDLGCAPNYGSSYRVYQVSHFQLKIIRTVKHGLSPENLERLVDAFATARLDYCNSILIGIPDVAIKQHKLLQNSAALHVSKTDRYEHITPVPKALHWLPIRHRIYFKISFLLIKPCTNWRRRTPARCYRYITQQGH